MLIAGHSAEVSGSFFCRNLSVYVEICSGLYSRATWQPYMAKYP